MHNQTSTKALITAITKAIKRGPLNGAVSRGRATAKRLGVEPAPVGEGNAKTDLPSTYRPVGHDGGTCPECPYLDNGCFAQYGWHVSSIQRRSPTNTLASIASATIAMSTAALQGKPARLHVSGDLFCNGELDTGYIKGLCEAGQAVQRRFKVKTCAWGYTHVSRETLEPWRLLMKASGIVFLYSDTADVGGAMVYPFELVPQLRKSRPDVRFVKCVEQLSDSVSCRTCGLCWESWERGFCIVFDPMGGGHTKARKASLYLHQHTTA